MKKSLIIFLLGVFVLLLGMVSAASSTECNDGIDNDGDGDVDLDDTDCSCADDNYEDNTGSESTDCSSCTYDDECASGYGCDLTGACVFLTYSCSDSDGSATAYTTKGKVTITRSDGLTKTRSDYCSTRDFFELLEPNILFEMSCASSKSSQALNKANGCDNLGSWYTCSEGACVKMYTSSVALVSYARESGLNKFTLVLLLVLGIFVMIPVATYFMLYGEKPKAKKK